LAAGAQVGIIIFTVFLVNLRHMLYAVSLVPYFKQVKHWQRVLMGFSLTDETFALVSNKMLLHPNSKFVGYYSGTALFMYLNWNIWTAIGFFVGAEFDGIQEFGLEIAMVVAFSGIVVSQLKNFSHYCCLLVAAIAAIFTYDWPHQTGILFSSFAGILAGLISDKLKEKS
jgi:predicted branched-subunit amino acid permease